MLSNKRVLVGVTASIAAYKSIFLIRLLIKEGASVQVVMTPDSHNFVTPLSLATVSKKPVYTEVFDKKTGKWQSHVAFGRNADLILIAPASVNTIAKMATGICNNLLLLTYFSALCPVFVAPAMDFDMYLHPTLQRNLRKLKEYGNIIIEPTEGELASGLIGKGRMEEPENIIAALRNHFSRSQLLQNKKILVTAGPTYEKIDPVRFISNFSSGKMGFALAEELANSGAEVELISGPTQLEASHPNIKKTCVISAEEMHRASLQKFDNCNGAILVAAVSDFKSKTNTKEKLKKSIDKSLQLDLIKTPDIAESLGKIKGNKFLAGFALETENEEANALEKLTRKNYNFIVLNSLNDKGAGFMHDTNRVTIIFKNGKKKKLPLKSKKEVAKDIVQEIATYFKK